MKTWGRSLKKVPNQGLGTLKKRGASRKEATQNVKIDHCRGNMISDREKKAR
jgi:hypothetical protein